MRLGYEETKPCPKCGSPMLKLSQWEKAKLSSDVAFEWGCHNDACELNRIPASYEIGASIGVMLRFLIWTGKVGLVVGVIWLIWRAL